MQQIDSIADQLEHADLQSVVAKLTYKEGCASLYESAKQHLGADKVHALCEALVQAYFFRRKPIRNGKEWLENVYKEHGAEMYIINVAAVQLIPPRGTLSPDIQKLVDITVHIASTAGLSVTEVSELMKQYTPLFQWEMQQRGFEVCSTDFYVGDKTYHHVWRVVASKT